MAARKRRSREKPIVRPGARKSSTPAKTGATGETPFDNYTVDRLKKIITNATPAEYEVSKLFVEGDHWQDREGWIGPHPEASEDGAEEMWTEIEDIFTSKNVVKEIVERHANGVLGRAPVWQFVPLAAKPASDKRNTANEDAVVAELELAVTRWWNKRNVHERIKDGVMQMLYGSRSPFRLYVPPDKIVAGEATQGVLRAATLEDALDYIFPEVPTAEEAAVYEEPNTRQQLGFFITKPIDPETGDPGSKEVIEMTYLLPDQLNPQGKPLTALRVKSDESDETIPVDLGGNLTMYEMKRPLLITEQLQQQQRALNLCLSMLPRNVITSGFLERIILDATLPGHWEHDADGKRTRFVLDRFHTGAGTTNVLVGVDTETEDGKKIQHASPDVKWREPSPVKPSIEAAQAIYLVMLEEGKQAHIILSGEALVSGTSREQARSDYDLSLTDSKAPAELLGEWVLSVAVALAEFFMGTPGKYTSKYRPVFQCHTFTGPVTWEERKQNDASVGKTLSQQRAMEMNGVVDVDAVLSQMMNESLPRATLLEAQGKALKALIDAYIPAELAAEMLGLDSKVIAAIKKQEQQALEAEAEARTTPPSTEE